MIHLTSADVRLRARAATKEEAIRQAAGILVANGNIEPGYVESMLGRELQANTYLGNGIAIPHGMARDRHLIRQTSIAVLQVPLGVTWNPGETVHLVVAIAASSDEHLGVLANLMEVLDNQGLAERLAYTDEVGEIVASLGRTPANAGATPTEERPGARSVEARLGSAAGLHARPATTFVELAGQFQAEIRVDHGGKTANGKALASLLRLGVERDDAPSEEEQYEAYTTMTRALNGLPLIIRTLDIGGDKVVPYLDLPREENPFLMSRGQAQTLARKALACATADEVRRLALA